MLLRLWLCVLLFSVEYCAIQASEKTNKGMIWGNPDAFLSNYVYESVNVITGEYCESQSDLTLSGLFPFSIRRIFQDSSKTWSFNVPLIKDEKEASLLHSILPNRKIIYEYDKNRRLIEIKTSNLKGNFSYHSLHLNYGPTHIEMEGSDGQRVHYQFSTATPQALEKITFSQGLSCSYKYQEQAETKKMLPIYREEGNGHYLSTEYYNDGKVKLQCAALGRDSSPIVMHRLVYHEGYTEVYDALNHKTIYRYSPAKKLTAIEQFLADQSGQEQLYRVEKLFWEESYGQLRLTCRAFIDGQGNVRLCHVYKYDQQGSLIKDTIYGDLSGASHSSILLQSNGMPEENGVEQYSIRYMYSNDEQHLLLSQLNDNGVRTDYEYYPGTTWMRAKFISDSTAMRIRHFYHYDENGLLIKAIVDDGSTKQSEDLRGVTERYITINVLHKTPETYGLPEWVEEYHLDLAAGVEKLLSRIHHRYSQRRELVEQKFFNGQGEFSHSQDYRYDNAGRRIETFDSRGNASQNTYDMYGNVLVASQKFANGQFSERASAYDYANRPIETKTIMSDGRIEEVNYSYDYMGNCLSKTDEFGHATLYEYDSLGRLTQISFPAVLDEHDRLIHPQEMRTYDIFNQVTSVMNAKGEVSRTSYNARGKPIEISFADGTKEGYQYYLDGTLSHFSSRDGTSIHYEYDYMARVIRTEHFDRQGKLRWVASSIYNPFRLLTTQDSNGRTLQHEKSIEDPKTLESTEKLLFDYQHINERGERTLSTTLIDELGNSTSVIYDARKRVERIIKKDGFGRQISEQSIRYDAVGNKAKEIYTKGFDTSTTLFIYGPGGQLDYIIEGAGTVQPAVTTLTYDRYGKIQQRLQPDGSVFYYHYDALGRLEELTTSDGSVHYYYVYDDENRLLQVLNGKQASKKPLLDNNLMSHTALYLRNPLLLGSGTSTLPEKTSCSFADFFDDLMDDIRDAVEKIADNMNSSIGYARNDLSFSSYIRSDMEEFALKILGESFLTMTGYYSDVPSMGVYGSGEINPKVRVTAINGILNLRRHNLTSVANLSSTHGGVNVHYVFYPTEGWTRDLIKSQLAKSGVITPHVRLLAQTWKEMIAEMGGPEGGGIIIHYAHSIGGTNTALARSLLTPEEQKMIQVITIGSATIIPNEGFNNVTNYISMHDLVCWTDPIGHLGSYLDPSSNVVRLDSGAPYIDHLLTMETYRRLVELLGKQFVEKYAE